MSSRCHPFRALLLVSVALLFFGCASSSSPTTPSDAFRFSPEPAPQWNTDDLRITTLNTEFLFDGSGEGSQIDFPRRGDPEAMRAHRRAVGDVLRTVDADVVMLQEIGSRSALDSLRVQMLADMGYTSHFVQGRDRFTGQDVAMLSRVPVDTVGRTDERAAVGPSRRTAGVSKNMFARLRLNGRPVTVIGLHFLARPDDPERAPRREAQAEVIRRLAVREIEQGRDVVVLGDFNDFDTIPDVDGNQPLTDVMQRIRSAGPSPDDDLVNVLADVPPDDRFSAHYDRNRNEKVDGRNELSAIDHILLSPSLYAQVRRVTYAQFYSPVEVTDHFPIVVSLTRAEASQP